MKRDPLQDFIDFLTSLESKRVNFVIVGAHAMAYWGYSRATGDIDILISPDKKNTDKLILALTDFGAPIKHISSQDFQTPGIIFQIGVPPVRIDIINALDGVETATVFKTAISGNLLGKKVKLMHINELIKNKKSTGREKDILDVKVLSKIKK